MRRNLSVIALFLLMMVLTMAIVGCGSKDKAFKDGTYQGEGEGKGGTMKVEVTISDGKISDIELLEHAETDGFWETPVEEITKQVIEKNRAKADAVSGATLTSKGFLEAIENALAQATE